MRRADRWRARALTGEALVCLAAARLLVAGLRFERWSASLGERCEPEASDPVARRDDNVLPRRLARAVQRASGRLPGQSRCLPQAMTLQWMLRRRGIAAAVHLGVRPGERRGALGDLHAWVTRRGEFLLGESGEAYVTILALRPIKQ